MRISVLAVMACLMCQQALAESRLAYVNGNELLKECRTKSLMCQGFIIGVADALESLRAPAPRTCRPEEVVQTQVLDLAVQALIDRPADRHIPAFDIVTDAFVEAWPC